MYYLVEFYHVKFVSPSAAIWTISFSEKAMNFISSVLYLTWIEVRSFMCLLLWRWICVFLIIEFQGYLLSIYCKGLTRVYIKHSHYFYLTSQYTLVYFPACSIPTWILNIVFFCAQACNFHNLFICLQRSHHSFYMWWCNVFVLSFTLLF